MAGITATYVDADTFTVVGDQTGLFLAGRRVKCDCGVDGIKYGTITSSAYTTLTTVNLSAGSDNLTSNLTAVWYGIIGGGAANQSMPEHDHTSAEGEGGEITIPTSPIKQIISKALTIQQTSNTVIAPDSTPTSSSGDAYDSQAITLDNAANKVRISGVLSLTTDNDAGTPTILFHRSTTVLAVYPMVMKKDYAGQVSFDFVDTPGSVGPHTYSIRIGARSNNCYVNRDKAGDDYGNFLQAGSNLTLTEIEV